MPNQRVLASGVFDILHPGHLHYLEGAKRHGDHLIVVVTSDGHAEQTKRKPMHAEQDRARMVEALEVVDEVLIGKYPFDLLGTTRQARPDVIALGHDQPFEPESLARELSEAGIKVRVVRISRSENATSTSALREGD